MNTYDKELKAWKKKTKKNASSVFWNFDTFLIDMVKGYCEWSLTHGVSYPGQYTLEEWNTALQTNLDVLNRFKNLENTVLHNQSTQFFETKLAKHNGNFINAINDPDKFPYQQELMEEENKAYVEVQEVFHWVAEHLHNLWD